MIGSKPTGAELQENKEAMSRRTVIVYLVLAILVFVCLIGLYFGIFIGQRLGLGG